MRRNSDTVSDMIAWDQGLAAMDFNNYIPYDRRDIADLLSTHESPEKLYMEKERCTILRDTYRSLSDEAQQIINIVIDTPQEMIGIFFSPNGKLAEGNVSRKRLIRMLRKQWKDARYVNQVIREIENFVKLF